MRIFMNWKDAGSKSLAGLSALAPRRIRVVRFLSRLRHSQAFSRQEGATLVETAVAYAILIPLLFGIIEFGYLFYAYQNVADASRRAARWAAVHGSSSTTACTGGSASQVNCNASAANIQAYVEGLNDPGITFSASNVSVSFLCVTYSSSESASWAACPSGTTKPNAPGNEVQVAVTYQFPLKIAYWNATTVNIGSTGSMVISY